MKLRVGGEFFFLYLLQRLIFKILDTFNKFTAKAKSFQLRFRVSATVIILVSPSPADPLSSFGSSIGRNRGVERCSLVVERTNLASSKSLDMGGMTRGLISLLKLTPVKKKKKNRAILFLVSIPRLPLESDIKRSCFNLMVEIFNLPFQEKSVGVPHARSR